MSKKVFIFFVLIIFISCFCNKTNLPQQDQVILKIPQQKQDTVKIPDTVKVPDVVKDPNILGDNFYLLNSAIDPNSTLVEVKATVAEWTKLTTDGQYGQQLQLLTKRAYNLFKDDFDCIFVVLNNPQTGSIQSALRFHGANYNVSNNVQGIGIKVASSSPNWGSASKLISVMYYPYYTAIAMGPALHEFSHNWGANMCPTYDEKGKPYDGHWGMSNAGGQLGGFKYLRKVEENSGGVMGKTKYQGAFYSDTKNPDGSFNNAGFGVNANGGNAPAYSDIELYMMGMKSAQQLRDANFKLDIYTGCSLVDENLVSGYFYSTGKISYTIDELIDRNGERVPDPTTSPKSFKILTLCVTPPATVSTATYYPTIITDIEWLGGTPNAEHLKWSRKNFKEATNNIGSLDVKNVKNSLKIPVMSK